MSRCIDDLNKAHTIRNEQADEIIRLRVLVRLANAPLVAYGFPLEHIECVMADAEMQETLERALRTP